jgi:hypothetical protein
MLGPMISADPFLLSTTNDATVVRQHVDEIGSSLMATTKYRLAKEERYINCVFDPNVIYECQGDSATTSAITDAGSCTIFIDGGGSTDTGMSGVEVDVSELGNVLRDTCFIWGVVPRADHNIGINDIYYVMINTHVLGGGTAGRIQGL